MNRLSNLLVTAFTIWAFASLIHAETCNPVGPEARRRLLDYVGKKYRLPPELTINLEESGFLPGSCYRKVRFVSAASAQFFDLNAILDPDQTFLVAALEDTRIDPIRKQEAEESARASDMLRGSPPSAGSENARSTVVVFSDFECPFCKSAAPVLKQVIKSEPRDVRVLFRNYPLPFHPWAFRAAQDAVCAAEQSQTSFWAVHDFLFENQPEITKETLDGKVRSVLAGTPHFDLSRYDACLLNESASKAIQADIDLGNANGVEGTPSIYVDGRKFVGALTIERLRLFLAPRSSETSRESPPLR